MTYNLSFKPNLFLPNELKDQWIIIINCFYGKIGEKIQKNFFHQLIQNCKLESNRNLIILNRSECGISTGNSNFYNKQLRPIESSIQDEILFDVLNSDSNLELWSEEELIDIGSSFLSIIEPKICEYIQISFQKSLI